MLKKPYALILFGPTAVGKTTVVEKLFAAEDAPPAGGRAAELISADSVQVYRGLDIGSAKPPEALRRKIPHHFIDILDPREQFTAGAFVTAAERLIGEICGRGHVPLVSGGTAFYFRNLVCGLPSTPPADPAIRRALEDECARRGLGEMYRSLQSRDPAAAQRISPNDRYRILRALEIFEAAGRPPSLLKASGEARSDIDFLVIGLRREKEDLHRRIADRVEAMFAQGLAEEVKGLLRQGLRETDPGMRGIGYREFFTALNDGCQRIKDVAAAITADSRRYAKRQLTFFKSIPGVIWMHPDAEKELRAMICAFVAARSAEIIANS
ncbi:MAG: tRNA (adenosine(37)-N6)-dimethylallyltransferase MiaA [Spirochaetaceae bacterium]|nr:tRNA (adenosine(37)-N6)-dimethylallyltransferase MiaA [Spirochaetaceae bacterium]